jgi:hypothetical protein
VTIVVCLPTELAIGFDIGPQRYTIPGVELTVLDGEGERLENQCESAREPAVRFFGS